MKADALQMLLKFKEALKDKLKKLEWNHIADDNGVWYSTETGWDKNIEIDWVLLDAEIDEFVASFTKEN